MIFSVKWRSAAEICSNHHNYSPHSDLIWFTLQQWSRPFLSHWYCRDPGAVSIQSTCADWNLQQWLLEDLLLVLQEYEMLGHFYKSPGLCNQNESFVCSLWRLDLHGQNLFVLFVCRWCGSVGLQYIGPVWCWVWSKQDEIQHLQVWGLQEKVELLTPSWERVNVPSYKA